MGLGIYFPILEVYPDWSPRTWTMVHGLTIRKAIDAWEALPVDTIDGQELHSDELKQFQLNYPGAYRTEDKVYIIPLEGFSDRPFGLAYQGYVVQRKSLKALNGRTVTRYFELFGDWYYYQTE